MKKHGSKRDRARDDGEPKAVRAAPALAALPDDLLARAPAEGARLLALYLTTRAGAAHAALVGAAEGAEGAAPEGAARDPEALHDFRVALRRLRVVLKAFGPELEGSVPKSVLRRLRDLARATNPARDAEVQLAWLAAQRPRLYSRQRAGAALLRQQLTAAHADAVAAAADAFGPRAGRTLAKLARALPAYTRAVRVALPDDHPSEVATFAGTLGARVRAGAEVLGDALASLAAARAGADVGGAAGESELAHEARLAAKRVRYLLAPVGRFVDGAPALLERLRALQDEFGTLHDLDVLDATLERALAAAEADAAEQAASAEAASARAAEASAEPADGAGEAVRSDAATQGAPPGAAQDPASDPSASLPDPRPGLQGLARRARTQREALAREIGERWLDGGARALVGELEACAAALEAAHAAPPVEIERKYLLRALPRALRGGTAAEVEQGYLPGERLRERVRRVVRDGRERFVRTVKLGAGVARIEVEEETTRELFDVLWPATRARRVRKRRYAVPEGALTWEVDEFTDRALVLAEVELPAPDTPVAFPPWLAAYVVREVTDDPAYLNSALAKPDAGGA
ncbi:hypothetical protein tb265_05580 [Gemmatimonadetes bacterium T265]|nr:hypothetical protein tb265_05580 [Gemmatimonadetes bacterium T265]